MASDNTLKHAQLLLITQLRIFFWRKSDGFGKRLQKITVVVKTASGADIGNRNALCIYKLLDLPLGEPRHTFTDKLCGDLTSVAVGSGADCCRWAL